MKKLMVVTVSLLSVLAIPGLARAVPINLVDNHSFETFTGPSPAEGNFSRTGVTVSDWNEGNGSAPDSLGVLNPGVGVVSYFTDTNAGDGSVVGYLKKSGWYTWQTIDSSDYVLNSGDQIDFNILMGWLDYESTPQPEYLVQLLAGSYNGTELAKLAGDPLVNDGFVTLSTSFVVPTWADGQDLTVLIMNTNSTTMEKQVVFDDVHLTATPVPEPTSLLLLGSGLLGLGLLRRRRR